MTNASPTDDTRRGPPLLVGAFVVLAVVAGAVLWMVLARSRSDGESAPEPTPTPTQEPVTNAPEPIPGMPAGALPPNTRKPFGPDSPPEQR